MYKAHSRIWLISLSIFVLLSCITTPSLFAADPIYTDPNADPNVVRTLGTATLKPDDKMYLDFKRATLLDVLTILAELSGINFVTGKEVADREINMMLDNVTFEDALEAIARGSNVFYQYIPERNVYLFRAAAEAAETPLLMTKVFKLYYIRTTKIREIESEGGDSGGGTGGTSSGTTFTMLSETESETEEESPILKVVESILSERGKVEIDDRSNSLVVTDVEGRIRLVEQAIAQLDRRIDQVLINVILIETFEAFDKFLGLEWGTTGNEGTFWTLTPGAGPTTTFPYNFLNSVGKKLPGTDGPFSDVDLTVADSALAGGTTSFATMTTIFKALQNANKLKVLAKPRILVMDNHPALIKITTNEAIGQQTGTVGAGDGVSTSVETAERTETGTSLRVTPLINMDNKITMTIEPRFVTSLESATVADTRDPTIRSARTTLMVNDGQTIVLGGLLDSRQENDVRKVPFLGDLPWVGEAFTRTITNTDDREMILFLTPTIVRDPAELQPASIPDQASSFDDLTAPFWKVHKKDWYKKIKEEGTIAAKERARMIDIAAKEKVMDQRVAEIARQRQQTPLRQLPPPSGTA